MRLVRKRLCATPVLQFYTKEPASLPRQARDKHSTRKSSKRKRSICFCRLSDSSLLAVLVGCDAALDSLGGAVHRVDDWCVVRTTSSLHLIPGPFRSAFNSGNISLCRPDVCELRSGVLLDASASRGRIRPAALRCELRLLVHLKGARKHARGPARR